MKLTFKIIVLFMLLVSSAKAQHDHSSHSHDNGAAHEHKAEPPHGGEIRDVGKYHFEIVFDAFTANEKLSVWILKSNLKVIDPKEFTGKVKIQYAEGKEVEKTLTVNGDKLFCNVEDITKAFTALIIVTIKGKEYHTTYNYKGLGK
ncbi:MAG TPA: hypothetical protein VLB84_20125 [Bacteroidia bacterium]|nr:hypothetical protein [Bacteroidia bacterium]